MVLLRELLLGDSDGMYEWLHDDNVIGGFRFNGHAMTMDDVKHFILTSGEKESILHRAIEADGEYAGTISFKNIDNTSENAELAIAVRTKFHGTGVAGEAMNQAVFYAKKHMGLHKLYLNVLTNNERAIRFYEKNGFVLEGKSPEQVKIAGEFKDLLWYGLIL